MSDKEKEKEKQEQADRARQHGITVKDGGNVTKPGKYADIPDDEFADPVNYRYPLDEDHIHAALAYWAMPKNRKQYSKEEQEKMTHRILAAAKRQKVDADPEKFTFAEIPGVEIFEAGTYRGRTYTEADLDRMVDNFGALGERLKPTLVIGHSEDQKLLEDSGIPAAGWISGLRRAGKKLLADFKEVPQVVADLIKRGAYKRTSAEIYTDFGGRGHALRRVALLGGAIPEVKTLQDVLALYDELPGGEASWVSLNEADPGEKRKKEDTTLDVEELKKLKERTDKLEAENERLRKSQEEATKKLSESEKARKKEKLHAFCEEQKKVGRLTPAMLEKGLVAFMERLDDAMAVQFSEKSNVSALDFMKEFISGLPAAVTFGEIGPSGVGKREDDERDGLIQKYMEQHKSSYKEAMVAVAKGRPELFEDR